MKFLSMFFLIILWGNILNAKTNSSNLDILNNTNYVILEENDDRIIIETDDGTIIIINT